MSSLNFIDEHDSISSQIILRFVLRNYSGGSGEVGEDEMRRAHFPIQVCLSLLLIMMMSLDIQAYKHIPWKMCDMEKIDFSFVYKYH